MASPKVSLLSVFVLGVWGSACASQPATVDTKRDLPDVIAGCEPTDTDGDGIADMLEGDGDVDGDGIVNLLDDDSDGDGLSDAEEWLPSDHPCRPMDSDRDGTYDPFDLDSDNDGVPDADEMRAGTDPRVTDTDGDGATDLAERAAGTDPTDASSRIPETDFFVVLPHMGPPEDRPLLFGTDIELADVFLLVDMTGSMRGERTNLVNGLIDVIIPGLEDAIDDVQIGVGGFDDYPVGSYGSDCSDGVGSCDLPFYLLNEVSEPSRDDGAWSLDAGPMTCPSDPSVSDIGRITGAANGRPDLLEAVEGLPCHAGTDLPESYVPALWATATGSGLSWAGGSIPDQHCASIPDEDGVRRGYPCFRPNALPIVLLFGDAPFHNGPDGEDAYSFDTPSYGEAVFALGEIGARVMGLYSGYTTTNLGDYERIAVDTGAVREDGTPLAFTIDSDGGGLDRAVVDAVAELVGGTPQDVSTRVDDVPDDPDGFDATRFITDVRPYQAYRDGVPGIGYDSLDYEAFYGVIPGTQVEFTVTFQNTVRPPADVAQVFQAVIVVLGNGVAELDRRNVYVIVPPDGATVLI